MLSFMLAGVVFSIIVGVVFALIEYSRSRTFKDASLVGIIMAGFMMLVWSGGGMLGLTIAAVLGS